MKKKNLLVSAIAMLVVSALGLTAATYAWFTASREPMFTEIDMGVTTSSSLQVSDKGFFSTFAETPDDAVTGTNWVQTLSKARMTSTNTLTSSNYSANYYAPLKLADSTPGAVGTVTPDEGKLLDDSAVGAVVGGGTTKTNYADMPFANSPKGVQGTFKKSISYQRFTVYFRAQDAQRVFLNLDTSTFLALTKTSLAPAIRVAFLVHTDAAATGIVPIVYTPNGSAANYGATQNGANRVYDGVETFGTDAVAASWSFTTPLASIPTFSAGDIYTYTDDATVAHKLLYLFDVNASTANLNDAIVAVTFYIWVEGFDEACINANAGGSISTLMNFYGVSKNT